MPPDSPAKLNTAARLRRTAPRSEPADSKSDTISAREIELKRSRGEISCAECRRLKIRCDKSIPCQSCQRRGCASLCPNGSLATGQGTRFVLAATEHLHRRISKMSDRVRQLEDALAILQAKSSNQPHPLLSSGRATSADPDEDIPLQEVQTSSRSLTDTFGMLSISDHGVSTFFGPTGGPEYLLINDGESWHASPGADSDTSESMRASVSPGVESALRFSAGFPFTPLDPPNNVMDLIRSYMPLYERACYVAESFLQNAAWMFSSVPRDQLMDEMIPFYYKEAPQATSDVDYSGPHSLALLLFIFATGAFVDPEQEPYNTEAGHYYQLARAALCLESVWAKPTLMTLQLLHLASVYTAMVENPFEPGDSSMQVSWGMLSLGAQLAQSMGMHRDSARWELPEKIVFRRRLVFWNIFQADSWQSLTTGRPPSFSRAYIDCKFPGGEDSKSKEQDASDFETWFTRFAFQCVADVALKTLSAEPPLYSTLLELDQKVHNFPVSAGATALLENLAPPEENENMPVLTPMQTFVIAHARETLLLYIHRSFFAQAIIDYPANPVRSPYAHSYLTAYRASCTIMKIIREQYATHPSLCARIWPIWTYGFSAAVVFGMVVTRGARSPMAPAAMAELDQACELFTQAGQQSRRAAKALVLLSKLQEKARHALAVAQNDPRPASGGGQSAVKVEDEQDQLEIFAGRTRVTASKSSVQSPSQRSAHSQAAPSVASSSQMPYTPPQLQDASSMFYPSSTQGSWVQQQMSHPAYAPPSIAPWYREGSYPQLSPDFAWSDPRGPHPSYPAQALAQGGDMVPSGSHIPAGGHDTEDYRHQGQVYPGPQGLHAVHHAPYLPPAQMVDLGPEPRESLDARWTSFMHDTGCLDDANYRT